MDENNKKSETALREERVLKFWEDRKIFQKSLEQTGNGKEFIFYEGPPTANGKPGIHHLEARAFKDVIPRYKTMRGYHVRRKAGWDTHGLPVELQVEKKLELDSKKAIEEYGIAKFNQECKQSVWEYVDLWEKFTDRVGYWLDKDNPYITYKNEYIESVWNILKETDNQKLLYKDYKVVPWCPRCGTALSSHELAQGYETVKDLSVTAKFRIIGEDNTYILAWTTTPWTLPGNLALAVGEKIDYVKVKVGNEFFILAKNRISLVENYEIVAEMTGKDLVGLEYEPPFSYMREVLGREGEPTDRAFRVYGAPFVTTEDGTGVVHTAVMYGQDDFELGTKVGLPKYHLVNPGGKFIAGTGFLQGRFVREETDGKPTMAIDIIKNLQERNLFFSKEYYQHSYPHCWRCHTALIYYARDSWYIRMSDKKIKDKLISENEKINWEPAHTREGRFGEWLREIKDWAISRERYWGTPLPVWECNNCDRRHTVGGLEELKNKSKKSGNKYFLMRHGEAEKNIKNIVNTTNDNPSPLTELGREKAKKAAGTFLTNKPDVIFVSPILRSQETAKILAQELGLSSDKVITDNRLVEIQAGELDNKSIAEYHSFFSSIEERFVKSPPGAENLMDVKRRTGEFIYDIEKKFSNKNILIISHEDPIWMLEAAVRGLDIQGAIKSWLPEVKAFINMGEVRALDFASIPHNQDYELDFHRPYIDEILLTCDCGGEMTRIKEVLDVWFDSGAMPFAEDHYPFENEKWIETKGYPADYISEAIDQTRGWFYTLHAIGVLMGRGRAYKNVICLGHLLDAKGKKMSKSIGNIVDPWEVMEKYGVDSLRLWMYSVNQPGESKNFDEKTVQLLQQQVFGLLYNVLAFYELYRNKSLEKNDRPNYKPVSKNILDIWILAKLDDLVKMATKNIENYKLLEPARAVKDFIGDLSTWYLRRSRERIKDGNSDAKQTLYFVLKTLVKIMAPFTPFAAEDIWLKLYKEGDEESVHLARWPEKKISLFSFGATKVLKDMEAVRSIVSLGLEARQKAGIKVRQPLSRLQIVAERLSDEHLEIIKDELNIKKIDYLLKIKIGIQKVTLDTKITPELKQEGDFRELVRALQDMRKKMGLTPSDPIALLIKTDKEGEALVQKFESELKRVLLASTVEFKENNGDEVKIDELTFKVEISK